MRTTPERSGRSSEVVVSGGRPRARAARTRMDVLRRRSQSGLHRVRAYLRTPAGQRMIARSAQAVVGVGAVLGAIVLVRHWLAQAARRVGALAAGVRAVFGAVGAMSRRAGRLFPLRWLGSALRWLTFGGVSGPVCFCPDCHARVRADARVCYRCGYRPGRGLTLGEMGRRRGVVWGPVLFGTRVALLRRHRRCRDCRRRVHADARVCGACGHRASRRGRA